MNPTLIELEEFFTDSKKVPLPKVVFKVTPFQKTDDRLTEIEKLFVQCGKPKQ